MRLGFIGCGNMAGAIIAGIIKKGLVSPDEIYGSNSTLEHANATHERLGIQTSTDNTLVALGRSCSPSSPERVISCSSA